MGVGRQAVCVGRQAHVLGSQLCVDLHGACRNEINRADNNHPSLL